MLWIETGLGMRCQPLRNAFPLASSKQALLFDENLVVYPKSSKQAWRCFPQARGCRSSITGREHPWKLRKGHLSAKHEWRLIRLRKTPPLPVLGPRRSIQWFTGRFTLCPSAAWLPGCGDTGFPRIPRARERLRAAAWQGRCWLCTSTQPLGWRSPAKVLFWHVLLSKKNHS